MYQPQILVSNDDGIFSAGLKALALVASELGKAVVVAPENNQSAVGHGITIRRPLRFKHTASAGFDPIPAYRVDGTPADCVILGSKLLGKPDLVLSGINLGNNLGFDLTHSGTVAAAWEAMHLGIPAIAFSQHSIQGNFDFVPALPYVRRIVANVLQHGLPPLTILNVNFPAVPPKGMRITTLSDHQYHDVVIEKHDPQGEKYYWLSGRPDSSRAEEADHAAVEQGFVSITPVRLELTHDQYVYHLKKIWNM